MRSIRILGVALACVVAACSRSDKSDATDSANASAGTAATPTSGMPAGGCVQGTWKKQDGTFTQTLTFNADKTGEEVHSREDTRTFTWSVKNDSTVHIAYTTAGSAKTDWDLNVDCPNNRLTNGFSK